MSAALQPDEDPQPQGRRGITRVQLFGLFGVVIAGVVAWQQWPESARPERKSAQQPEVFYAKAPSMDRLPPLPAATPAAQPAATPPAAPTMPSLPPAAAAPSMANSLAASMTPKTPRPRTVTYASAATAASAGGAAPAGAAPGGAGAAAGDMTSIAYKPASIPGGVAGLIPHPERTLMPQILQCNLINAIDSTVPGPVWCVLESDALSPTNVILMEKGTQIFADYKAGLQQGQDRIMVMTGWARTPKNVIVPLEGPMADGLGRAGIKGDVDTHFWDRFGGAILMSFVSSAFQGLSNLGQSGNNNQSFNIQAGPVQNLASDVLRNTINILPTLSVNQGATVSIFIRYPIDFSYVYKLEDLTYATR